MNGTSETHASRVAAVAVHSRLGIDAVVRRTDPMRFGSDSSSASLRCCRSTDWTLTRIGRSIERGADGHDYLRLNSDLRPIDAIVKDLLTVR